MRCSTTVPTAILCLVVAGFSQSLAMISIAVILMVTGDQGAKEHSETKGMEAHP